jgi:hypothetical protein
MTAQGATKRRTLLRFMRNGFRTQPALLVRGSSRRIMSMRFRPAHIRVINRRASSWAVIGSAVQTRVLGAHQRERVPATPPVEVSRVVPQRCSRSRVRFAAPQTGAPLTAVRRSGRGLLATGGSDGNTPRKSRAKTKPRFPSLREKPRILLHETVSLSKSPDKVAPYQNTNRSAICTRLG